MKISEMTIEQIDSAIKVFKERIELAYDYWQDLNDNCEGENYFSNYQKIQFEKIKRLQAQKEKLTPNH